VLGPRSGLKDEHNELLVQRQPGYLAEALGGRVEQFYALEKDISVSGEWGSGQASIWAEQLSPRNPDTQILMRFGKSNGWLDEQPAAITRNYGKGRITYVGAILDEKLMKAAAEWMVKECGAAPAFISVPDSVEVSVRSGAGKRVFVLINFAQETQKINLGKRMKLLLSDGQGESVELAPYGVEVLQVP
jgi:beta-galactosidase